MELRQLEYFVQVVELGGFSRAAVALDLAQPSLSRQVALLEGELGQRLLVRTGRGAIPTEAGNVLLAHARAMIASARSAREELHDMDGTPGGRVVVGIPPRVALGLGVALVQRFRERFPRAVITVIEAMSVSLRESLIAGRLDMALLFDPPPSPQLSYTQLMREPLLLVAPRSQALPARVSLPSLADYPMVLPSSPNAIRKLIDAALRPRRITLRVIAEVGAVNTIIALVASGIGCTILPESAVTPDMRTSQLARAPIGPPKIWNSLVLAESIARPATRLTRGTSELLRELDFRRGS